MYNKKIKRKLKFGSADPIPTSSLKSKEQVLRVIYRNKNGETVEISKELYIEATTPGSIANIYPDVNSYENLEYLGDGCLHMCLTDYLFFHKNLPDGYDPGHLTKLRSNFENNDYLGRKFDNLTLLRSSGKIMNIKDSIQVTLNKFKKLNERIVKEKLRLPRVNVPELKGKIRADMFEALIGAIYKHYRNEGYTVCFEKIKLFLTPIFDDIDLKLEEERKKIEEIDKRISERVRRESNRY